MCLVHWFLCCGFSFDISYVQRAYTITITCTLYRYTPSCFVFMESALVLSKTTWSSRDLFSHMNHPFAIQTSDRNSHRHEECYCRNNKIQFFTLLTWTNRKFVCLSSFLSHSVYEPNQTLIKKLSAANVSGIL